MSTLHWRADMGQLGQLRAEILDVFGQTADKMVVVEIHHGGPLSTALIQLVIAAGRAAKAAGRSLLIGGEAHGELLDLARETGFALESEVVLAEMAATTRMGGR